MRAFLRTVQFWGIVLFAATVAAYMVHWLSELAKAR